MKNGVVFRAETYGGKLSENVTQAVARDVLVHGIRLVAARGFEIVLTVHGEFLVEVGRAGRGRLPRDRTATRSPARLGGGEPKESGALLGHVEVRNEY